MVITITRMAGANAVLSGLFLDPSTSNNTAKTLTIAGVPSTVTAGTTYSVTVTAYDAYGNVATGYTGTVSLTSSDPHAVLPASYTFTAADAGVAHLPGHARDGRVRSRSRRPTRQRRASRAPSRASSSRPPASIAGRHRLPHHRHGRHGRQRHRHRLRRLRQRGDRLHRHGGLHQQRRAGRPAGQLHLHRRRRRRRTPSRSRSRPPGRSRSRRPTRASGITGTESGITVQAAAAQDADDHRLPHHRHGGHGRVTSPSPPTTPTATWRPATPARSHFTSSDPQGRPAGQLHLHRRRRGHAYLLRHARDGRHAVDHGDRHDASSLTGTESGIVGPGRRGPDADGHRLPDHRHGRHGRTTSRSPPTTPTATWRPATPARSHFTSSDAKAVLPANYTFIAADAGHAHLLGHARDGRHAVDHGDRHGDVEHHGKRSASVIASRCGRVRQAGHDDAGELDRDLRHARATTSSTTPPACPATPPSPPRASRPTPGPRPRPTRAPSRPPAAPAASPPLVLADQLHGRREPDRRPDARPGAVLPRLGQHRAGPSRCRSATRRRARC